MKHSAMALKSIKMRQSGIKDPEQVLDARKTITINKGHFELSA